jgi:bifunctional non-homologous end joining protein LigD
MVAAGRHRSARPRLRSGRGLRENAGPGLKAPQPDVAITNPDKTMYPAVGFTKADVIRYYTSVAPYLLPHLERRPVALKRYPDGIAGKSFWEKDAPRYRPPWVKTAAVPRVHGGPDIEYVLVNDARTLAWCANLAALELHPFLHRAPALHRPTAVVFDLDPGAGRDVLDCVEVAAILRDTLGRLGLRSFPKVSGSKGLQVYVPLNTPVTYHATGTFAYALARRLEGEHPRLIVSDMAKAKRADRILIDWSQNAWHKTTVAVYSLRAKRERPFVSMPITWHELSAAATRRDPGRLAFEPAAALARLSKRGDLFEPVLTLAQTLPNAFASAGAQPARRGEARTRTA